MADLRELEPSSYFGKRFVKYFDFWKEKLSGNGIYEKKFLRPLSIISVDRNDKKLDYFWILDTSQVFVSKITNSKITLFCFRAKKSITIACYTLKQGESLENLNLFLPDKLVGFRQNKNNSLEVINWIKIQGQNEYKENIYLGKDNHVILKRLIEVML